MIKQESSQFNSLRTPSVIKYAKMLGWSVIFFVVCIVNVSISQEDPPSASSSKPLSAIPDAISDPVTIKISPNETITKTTTIHMYE